MTANIIRFTSEDILNSEGKGNIATLSIDADFTAKPNTSTKENSPTHDLFALSPKGQEIMVGAIWQNTSKAGNLYFTLSIPVLNFRANLGQAAGQDEVEVQAIIPWTSKP